MSEINLKVNDRLWFFNEDAHNIMWCDYSSSSEDEMITLFNEAFEITKTAGSSIKVLANFRSTPRSPRLTKLMRESGKWYKQAGVDVKIGVVGINSPFTKVVMNATMAISRVKNLRLFEDREDALGWLTESVLEK